MVHGIDMDEIRVFLIEDDQAIGDQLAAIIAGEPDLQLAGYSDGTGDVYSLLQTMAPDIVVVNYRLPEVMGGELTRRLKAILPGLRIIALAPESAQASMRAAGADGLLTQDQLPQLASLVRELSEGGQGSTGTQ